MGENREKRGCRVRPVSQEAAASIAALEAVCFPGDAWSERDILDSMARRVNHFLVAEDEEGIVGYCSCQAVLDEGDVFRVAVLPDLRRRGIGSALMEGMYRCCPEVTIWNLDVREHNTAAIELYRRYGFEAIGSRKNYYHDPVENAVLMQYRIPE